MSFRGECAARTVGVSRPACATLMLIVLACGGRPACAQGNDATTSTVGSATNAHPVPLLSTSEVISVPTAKAIAGGAPLPREFRPLPATGLGLPGPIALRSPARLFCADIRDETARNRCRARGAPAAPPK